MNGVRFGTGALGARGSNKWLMAVPCEYADSVGQQVTLPDVSGGKIISSCLCCSVCLDILLLSQKSIEHPCNDAQDLPNLNVRKGNLYNHP